eukprot:6780301-Prymnesium_polylepis.1
MVRGPGWGGGGAEKSMQLRPRQNHAAQPAAGLRRRAVRFGVGHVARASGLSGRNAPHARIWARLGALWS